MAKVMEADNYSKVRREGDPAAYNGQEMAVTVVRRILFGGMAAWVFVIAWEQYRLGGHTGAAVGLALGGLLLVTLAVTGKGG
jgi:hypothetical protein